VGLSMDHCDDELSSFYNLIHFDYSLLTKSSLRGILVKCTV
jgi:hypothetical protein